MTTISETAGAHSAHAVLWHRTTHALGKLWAKVIALPEASSGAARRDVPSSDYFNFPPF